MLQGVFAAGLHSVGEAPDGVLGFMPDPGADMKFSCWLGRGRRVRSCEADQD